MTKTLTGEAAVKRAITDLLDAERIPYWPMNAGDRFGTYKGKTWRIRGQQPGTADLLAAPRAIPDCASMFGDKDGCLPGNRRLWICNACSVPQPPLPNFLWIECKRPKGGLQSEAQREFERFVTEQGHIYVLATSSDDVLAKLRELGCTSSEDNPVKLPRVRVKAAF